MRNRETPTTFGQIIGQKRAITFLKQALARGKIPHAYLFAGQSGVGKTCTAVALTRAINCVEKQNEEGCGRCKSCRLITAWTFPDLVFIEPDGQNVKIEQIRELNRALSFKPTSGRYRVSIISRAETMTEEAANSLLKSLEEPPPNNVLILEVPEPLAILPTIFSRCQKILFRPIPVERVRDWLVEEKGVERGQASLLAKISEGSLGRAMDMSEGDFLKKREDHISSLIQLPSLSDERLLEMASEFSGREKKGSKKRPETGDLGLGDVLSIWKTWYRDLLISKEGCREDLLINKDFSQKLKNISKSTKIINLINGFMTIDQAQRDLQRNRNLDLVLVKTFLTLKRLSSPSA